MCNNKNLEPVDANSERNNQLTGKFEIHISLFKGTYLFLNYFHYIIKSSVIINYLLFVLNKKIIDQKRSFLVYYISNLNINSV